MDYKGDYMGVQYQFNYFQQKNIRMIGKQDELLQKLQKCVGRLQTKPATTDRYPQAQQTRYPYPQLPQKKPHRQVLQQRPAYFPEPQPQPVPSTLDSRKPKWNNNDQQNIYTGQFQQYQPKSTRASLSKNYLTERKYGIGEELGLEDRRGYQGEGKRRYEDQKGDQENYGGYQVGKRVNNYLDNSEKPRRPLREYELNATPNNFTQNNSQLKPQRSYLPQQKPSNKYEVSSPKFQQYKPQEPTQKSDLYRRNSISYNENYSRSTKKQTVTRNNFDTNTKISQTSNYRSKEYVTTPRGDQDMLYIGRSQRIGGGGDSLQMSHSRDMSVQAKTRQTGIGSISSITKRPSLDCSKASYQTFQPKQHKQLNLQQILNEVGSANQDTFSKLQKISELNERINMRIKNIIQTFQAK